MPTYEYKCEKCGHEFEEMFSISLRKKPTEVPCERQLHSTSTICGGEIIIKAAAPGIGDPVKLGIRKPDKNFNDKLNAIKKAHIGSTIQTRD